MQGFELGEEIIHNHNKHLCDTFVPNHDNFKHRLRFSRAYVNNMYHCLQTCPIVLTKGMLWL